jgi:hypothetical protein
MVQAAGDSADVAGEKLHVQGILTFIIRSHSSEDILVRHEARLHDDKRDLVMDDMITVAARRCKGFYD